MYVAVIGWGIIRKNLPKMFVVWSKFFHKKWGNIKRNEELYGRDQKVLPPFSIREAFSGEKIPFSSPGGNPSFLFFAGLDFFLFPHHTEIGKKREGKNGTKKSISPRLPKMQLAKILILILHCSLLIFPCASLIFPRFFLGKKADILFFEFEFSRRRPGAFLRGLPWRPHQSRCLAQLVHRLSGKQDDLQGFTYKK